MNQSARPSGVLVTVEPADFTAILARAKEPLVVIAPGGWLFQERFQYLTSYKGLAFYTKSVEEIPLPAGTEVIQANKLWMPH